MTPQTTPSPAPIGTAVLQVSQQHAELIVSGNWTQDSTLSTPVESLVSQLEAGSGISRLVISAAGLGDWDSRLPTYLLKITDYCQSKGWAVDVSNLPKGVQGLVALARAVPERKGARRTAQETPFLERLGLSTVAAFKDGKNLVTFVGETILASLSLLQGKARYRKADLYLFIQDSGPDALPIVSLISLLVGLILAFVAAVQLSMFGAQIFIANLVSLGMLREMGALMTAIIMSGRTGAAFAAQLGTMNVNSEIDALKTMGLNPMQFLVLPRMLALFVMMPLLTLYSNLMGILGGALVTVSAFDVSLLQYYNASIGSVHLNDLALGLVKSVVFALLIATAGCMRGMQCGRSASAVGDAATAAVVNSIVYIVVADALMTLVANQLGV